LTLVRRQLPQQQQQKTAAAAASITAAAIKIKNENNKNQRQPFSRWQLSFTWRPATGEASTQN